jgi:acetolactate synthase-1/2/3 large subunit
MIRVADYVADTLVKSGVRHLFMLPGGAAMHLNDAVARRPELEIIGTLHEQAAAIASEANARITGTYGACMVTAGPGGTNAITGIAGAWLDSTPCIFLGGQVKSADLKTARGVRQYGVQEIDLVSIVTPITKYAVTITDPKTVRYHMEKALHLAMAGRRGPVWLEFPLDVQAAKIDPDTLESFQLPTDAETGNPNLKTLVTQAIAALNKASRPIILAGNGVRNAGALKVFREFAEKHNIPVLTTWLGMDLIEADHPLYVGRPGSMAPRGANFALQNADWLLTIGTRLDLALVGYSYERLARGATKVVVDIDEAEIRKLNMRVDVPVCADAKDFLEEAAAQSASIPDGNREAWLSRCREWKTKYPLVLPEHRQPGEALSAYHFSERLSDALDGNDIVAPGSSGFACEIFLLNYQAKAGQRMFHNRGTGAMGFGLPSSIGACIGSGRRRTICVDGDGGFQMNVQELETVRRLQLPIKFFVINNSGYASMRASQGGYFKLLVCADATSGLTLPDIKKVAEAYGLKSFRIDSTENLDEKIHAVLAMDGPVVCEVVTRPDEARIPRLSSYQKPDGNMASKPIEDLFPFLDREEFLANMLVPPVED